MSKLLTFDHLDESDLNPEFEFDKFIDEIVIKEEVQKKVKQSEARKGDIYLDKLQNRIKFNKKGK
jgi:hypothetical protein